MLLLIIFWGLEGRNWGGVPCFMGKGLVMISINFEILCLRADCLRCVAAD